MYMYCTFVVTTGFSVEDNTSVHLTQDTSVVNGKKTSFLECVHIHVAYIMSLYSFIFFCTSLYICGCKVIHTGMVILCLLNPHVTPPVQVSSLSAVLIWDGS